VAHHLRQGLQRVRALSEARGGGHNLALGYLLWIFGFMGAHRFYYGRPVSGTIWFFTLGLLFVGWIIDLFLIPSMDRAADRDYPEGAHSYNVSWVLLTFLGALGIHRFYLGKWLTGIVYLLTVGLFMLGVLYDYWTLNAQVREVNSVASAGGGRALD
jgi:TM2 domain-containing membrane protein YozV